MEEKDWTTLILLIIVGIWVIYVFFGQAIATWWGQNWWIVAIVISVIAIGGIAFYIKIWLPIEEEVEEKLRKEKELKKSIIRKRLSKERANQLEGLGLTDEEKEFQLDQWVEEEYKKEVLGYEPKRRPRAEPRVEIVPPLSQSQKERLIRKVGTRCCYPNCNETITLEVHHITPREEGGTNKESNLVVLCPSHHAKADRGVIPKARLRQYSVARMKKME